MFGGTNHITPEGYYDNTTLVGPVDDSTLALGDLDQDGYGEFIVVGNQQATIFDTDCSMLHQWPLIGGGTGGPRLGFRPRAKV